MTPTQKSNEIIENFKPYMYCYLGSGMLSNSYDKDIELNNAKRCALLMVNQIIELDDFSTEGREYWQAVKIEINNYGN